MPGIFISYRRDDSGGYAGRLHERLSRRFGKDRIFFDIDTIPVGHDFVRVLSDRVTSCEVAIVLIGKSWLSAADRRGRRLDDPGDFVRLEIMAALERGVPIVPVLVGGAQMPPAERLPGPISRLAYLNAFEVNDRFFDESLDRLVKLLSPFLKSATPIAIRQRVKVAAITGTLLLIAIILVVRLPERGRHEQTVSTPAARITEPAKSNVAIPKIPVSPKVEDRIPTRITTLPPIIETARNGFEFEDAVSVNGPRNPKLLWQAEFGRENMQNWGVAGDGTLLLSTGGGAYKPALVAIHDGQEQWAYELKSSSPSYVALDGRVWVDEGSRALCFNTRGEGGRIVRKENSGRLDYEILKTRHLAHGFPVEDYASWQCQLDKLSGRPSGDSESWNLLLDGDCVSSVRNRQGNILVGTETGTIYSVTKAGRIRWTYKSDCKLQSLLPLNGDEALGLCEQSFFGLRNGKRQWSRQSAYSGQTRDMELNSVLFDKSNTIYLSLGFKAGLAAIDHSGTVIWSRNVDGRPRLLDQKGWLYVTWGGSAEERLGIACLADR